MSDHCNACALIPVVPSPLTVVLLSLLPAAPVPEGVAASNTPLKDWEFFQKYFKMMKIGLPRPVVEHKMISEVRGELRSCGTGIARPCCCINRTCAYCPVCCRAPIQLSWTPTRTAK